MEIHESAENYLERILMLMEEKGYARSTDIAAELNVTKPSVSVAMKKLRENNYITMAEDGMISLTDKGYAIARRIYDRHKNLTKFLVDRQGNVVSRFEPLADMKEVDAAVSALL